MKRAFKLENLDCANCAAKMEAQIQKLEGVASASINFMSQRLILEAADDQFDEILQQAKKVIKKIEPDCTVS